MYKNLVAEMAKKSIAKRTMAKHLNLCETTLQNKIKGKSSFNIEESFAIKERFFPDLELQYLFANE